MILQSCSKPSPQFHNQVMAIAIPEKSASSLEIMVAGCAHRSMARRNSPSGANSEEGREKPMGSPNRPEVLTAGNHPVSRGIMLILFGRQLSHCTSPTNLFD